MRTVKQFDRHIIEQGWSDELANDLVASSLEPTIRAATPRDTLQRFRSIESAFAWHTNPEKSPFVYSLRDEALRKLGGIAWFSQQTHPDIGPSYQSTFAIRLYESTRGQGLSYLFAAAVHEDFASSQAPQNTSGVWLETDNDNAPAIKLYQKLGYRVLTLSKDRAIMGLTLDLDEEPADLERK